MSLGLCFCIAAATLHIQVMNRLAASDTRRRAFRSLETIQETVFRGGSISLNFDSVGKTRSIFTPYLFFTQAMKFTHQEVCLVIQNDSVVFSHSAGVSRCPEVSVRSVDEALQKSRGLDCHL